MLPMAVGVIRVAVCCYVRYTVNHVRFLGGEEPRQVAVVFRKLRQQLSEVIGT